MRRIAAAVLLGMGFVTNTFALELIVGRVTLVEPTYLPGVVSFLMDSGSPSCPVGHTLRWANSNIDNNKAVYASLLAAAISGTRVRMSVNDGDTTCTGQYLHIWPSG